jgi:molecular chaperone HscB
MGVTQTSASASADCWSCRAATNGGHFCPACGKIQPLARGTGYFAFFGLPERLQIDRAELERQFLQLSWKLHPDNFVRASEYERNLSLELSSVLNDAYRALREPVSRVEYLLARHGVRKERQTKQQAPPELLEEVFELNESLDELRLVRQSGGHQAEMAGLREQLAAEEKNFQKKLAEVDAELETAFCEWDAALDAGTNDEVRKKLMARMNEILNRRSYIRNLVANVQKELAEA